MLRQLMTIGAIALPFPTILAQKTATVTVDPASARVDTLLVLDPAAPVVHMLPDANGKFVVHLPVGKPRVVTLSWNKPARGRVMLFVEPGDDVQIRGLDDSTRTYAGAGGKKTEVMNRIYTSLKKIWGDIDAKTVAAGTPTDLYRTFDHMFDSASLLLESQKKDLSQAFYDDQRTTMDYQRISFLLDVPFWYERLSHKPFSQTIPDNYWDVLKQVRYDDRLLDNELYRSTIVTSLPAFLDAEYKVKSGKPDSTFADEDLFSHKYRRLEELLTGKTRLAALRSQVIQRIQTAKNPATARPAMDAYLAKYEKEDSPEGLKELHDTHVTTLSLAVGQPVPSLTLKDIHGKEVNLTDFAGKVVYMDFWASWCGPCRAEMKSAAPKLRKMFEKNSSIVFLYINMDEALEAGKKAIAQDKIRGTHLFSGGISQDNPIAKAFNITGVPRYVIIGKDGKILDNDAPRPSNAKTAKLLRDAAGTK